MLLNIYIFIYNHTYTYIIIPVLMYPIFFNIYILFILESLYQLLELDY